MSQRGCRLSVQLAPAREAFLGQAQRFLVAAGALDDYALLGASRCHGWAAVDVVVHVRAGLEEMLRGVTAPTDAAPTVDAATYWLAGAQAEESATGVDDILWTRRTASAYRRPSLAVRHLRDATNAIMDAVPRVADGSVAFQGHVLGAGDFLATWAVELAVHHVDLGEHAGEPTPAALRLTRDTVSALHGWAVPAAVSDLDALLIGAGRALAPTGQNLRAVFG